MKKDNHPKYYQATITCACGTVFQTGSTVEKIEVEICSACHPFFTGKSKLIDTARRVNRFEQMREKTKTLKGTRASKKERVKKEKEVIKVGEK